MATPANATPAAGAQPRFKFDVPVTAFSKAEAPVGQQRRIAGVISTEGLDQQNERLVQEGLNFDKFLKDGWYNDNHDSKSTCALVGYPDKVEQYKKGDTLPNGQKATESLTWAEGFLIGSRGAEIWQLAKDLEGSGRSLGFSVEGAINRRDRDDRGKVLSADVLDVAVCAHPVNRDCYLEPLLRSLNPASGGGGAARPARRVQKTMTCGEVPEQSADHPIPQPEANKPVSGQGVGQVLSAQYGPLRRLLRRKKKTRAKAASAKKALNPQQALDYLQKAAPGLRPQSAKQILKTAQRLMALGLV